MLSIRFTVQWHKTDVFRGLVFIAADVNLIPAPGLPGCHDIEPILFLVRGLGLVFSDPFTTLWPFLLQQQHSSLASESDGTRLNHRTLVTQLL